MISEFLLFCTMKIPYTVGCGGGLGAVRDVLAVCACVVEANENVAWARTSLIDWLAIRVGVFGRSFCFIILQSRKEFSLFYSQLLQLLWTLGVLRVITVITMSRHAVTSDESVPGCSGIGETSGFVVKSFGTGSNNGKRRRDMYEENSCISDG